MRKTQYLIISNIILIVLLIGLTVFYFIDRARINGELETQFSLSRDLMTHTNKLYQEVENLKNK